MWYAIAFFVGMVIGTLLAGLAVMEWYRKHKQKAAAAESQSRRAKEATAAADAKEQELAEISKRLFQERQEFDARVIAYRELEQSHRILKRDLQNIDVQLNRFELDRELQRQQQKELEDRNTQLTRLYLSEAIKSMVASLWPTNLAACKGRLSDLIAQCRANKFPISEEDESNLLQELRTELERRSQISVPA